MRQTLLLPLAAAVSISCSTQPPHQNPFDPNSPPSAQAKASVAGSIELESPGAAAPSKAGVHISILGSGLSADTGADGAFLISGVSPGTWTLQASKDGYETLSIPGVLVRLSDGGSTVDVPAAQLKIARGTVSGKILLEGETQHAGVTVSLAGFAGAAQTDPAGGYSLVGVPAGTYSLTAGKVAFTAGTVPNVQVVGGQTVHVSDLTLAARPGSISGSVVVTGAASSAGVSVIADGWTLGGNHHVANGTTGTDGTFTISAVPAGTYTVTAQVQDFVPQLQSVVVAPAADSALPVVTLVRETGSVVGNARMQGSTDNSGIQVQLTPKPTAIDPDPDPVDAALTDFSGSWRIDTLAVGDYDIAYQKLPGYLSTAGAVTIVKHAVVTAAPVELEAIPGLVRGVVTLEGVAGGGDLSGTTARIEGTTLATATIADGSFALFGVGAGAQTVVLERTGYDTERVQAALGPGDTVDLFPVQLGIARGAVHGTLIVEERSDASGVQVSIAGQNALTDHAGTFHMSGVPAGTWPLNATLNGYAALPTATATITAHGDTEAPASGAPASERTLLLLRTASVSGKAIYDPAAPDQLGTSAALTGADENGVAVSATASTAASGTFGFSGLAAGAYRIVLTRSGYEPLDLGLVPVAAGGAVLLPDAALQISRGSIAGRFTLTGASDSSGVVVAVRGTTFATVTTSTGAFVLDGLPVGAGYILDALKPPDWTAASVTGLAVTRNATTTIPGSPVAMQPVQTASIAGTATLEGAAAGGNAGIVASLTGTDFLGAGVSLSATTSAAGAYSFTALKAGTYAISFSFPAGGFDGASVPSFALASAGSAAPAAATLAIARGRLAGVYQLAGVTTGNWAGIVVNVAKGAFSASAVTDAAGSFSISGIPVGSGYTATASKQPDWASSTAASLTIASGATTTVTGSPITLQPLKTSAISGVCSREGSATGSWGGTTVTLSGTDFRGTAVGPTTTTTSAAGAYSFSTLAAGTYQISFSATGFDPGSAPAVTVASGSSAAATQVQLALSRGSISGVFQLAGLSSGAWAGIAVALSGGGYTDTTVTDATGAFKFLGVPVGSGYSVTASKTPDWVAATASGMTVAAGANTAMPGSPIALQPLKTSAISGTVSLEGLSTGSWNGTTVTLTGTDFRGTAITPATASTAADGTYSFSTLAAGSYHLDFAHGAYEPGPGAAASVGSASSIALSSIQLAMSRGSLAGVIQLAGVTTGSWAGIVVNVAKSGFSASAVTDAAGNFSISGIPVGSGYTATASKQPDWVSSTTASLTINAGATTTVTGSPLTLQPLKTSAISGVCSREGSATGSWGGTTVTLSGTDFRGTAVGPTTTTTSGAGAYSFTTLAAGTYQISFSATGFDPGSAPAVTVASGSSAAATQVQLAISRGSISGVFQLAGLPTGAWAGIAVALSGGGYTDTTVTDAAGTFKFLGVPVGSGYSITASKTPDWVAATASGMTVSAGTNTAMPGSPIALQPLKASAISGVVSLEGVATGGWNGTTVTLSGTDFRGTAITPATTSSATDGTFSFSTLAAGSYHIDFARASYEAGAGAGASVGSATSIALSSIQLALQRGSLTGTATATGAADKSGTVIVISGAQAASTVTDSTGAYTVTGLRTGSYTVTAQRPGYTTSGGTAATVNANASTTVGAITIAASTTAQITGVATLQRNTGNNSGITVTYTGTDLNGATVSGSATAATDSAGNYTITGLKQGTYAVTGSKTKYDNVTLTGIFVAAGASPVAPSMVLPVSLGTVAGTVQLNSGISGFGVGTDYSGITVALTGADVPIAPTVTDTSGGYRFTGVPVTLAGTSFTITATRPNFSSNSTTVLGVANGTATAATFSISVNSGSASGTVSVNDNVANGGPTTNASAGVVVSLTGVAFNGNSFSTSATSAASGAWSKSGLPPGSYQLIATSTNHTCQDIADIAVPGPPNVVIPGTTSCIDAIAPGAVVLNTPVSPINSPSVNVTLQSAVTDATSPATNFRGYQYVKGATPNWSNALIVTSGLTIPFSGLQVGTNTLWVRAVDWSGNAGVEASVEVVYDNSKPAKPVLTTPQAVIAATTTSVTLSGSEGDANFDHYELCTATVAASATCPGTCTGYTTQPSTAAVSLTPNQRTCVFGRAADLAGNISDPASISIVSDLTAPGQPVIAPSYEVTSMDVHTDSVDVFIGSIPSDLPTLPTYSAGGYHGVAWLELDTGAGFQPICRQCGGTNAWNPCDPAACTTPCTNNRVRCVGTSLNGLHVPVARGTTSTVAVRAVDLAGNVGDGASIDVSNLGARQLVTGQGGQQGVKLYGNLLGFYTQAGANQVLQLGANRRANAGQTPCTVGSLTTGTNALSAGVDTAGWAIPGAPGLVFSDMISSNPTIRLRPASATNYPCGSAVFDTTLYTEPSGYGLGRMSLNGNTLAWFEFTPISGTTTVKVRVREPGPNHVLGDGDDITPSTPVITITENAANNRLAYLTLGGERYLMWMQGDYCASGCTQSYNFQIANASSSGFGGSNTFYQFMARTAALSGDGLRLARVGSNLKAVEVCDIGPDLLWGTIDDACVTSSNITSTSTPDSWALAIEKNRVVGIALYGGTSHTTYQWSTGPDGAYAANNGGDDVVSIVSSGPTNIQSLALDQGLLVYSQGDSTTADILSTDLSTFRWETASATGNYSWPVLNGGGTLVYLSDTANNLVRARTPGGQETTTQLETSVQNGRRPIAATNGDLLSASFGSNRGLTVTNAGADGVFFSGDAEPTATFFTSATTLVDEPSAADGKGFVLIWNGTQWLARVLEPNGSGTLTSAATTVVAVGSAGSVDYYPQPVGGISRFVAAWINQSNNIVYRPSGANGIYESAGDDPATSNLKNGAGGDYTGANLRVSGARIGFTDTAKTQITIVTGRPDGTGYNGVFPLTIPLPNGLVDWNMGGSLVAWIDGNFDVWVADAVTQVVNRIAFHYSTKDKIFVEPGGRIVWEDSLFPYQAVFTWVQ